MLLGKKKKDTEKLKALLMRTQVLGEDSSAVEILQT